MAKAVKKYTGILDTPLEYQDGSPLFLLSDEENDKRAAEAKSKNEIAVLERVIALFKFYNINLKDEGAWQQMVMALAFAHVPGFVPKFPTSPRRGKPRQWDLITDTRLYVDVQKGLKNKQSISAVCLRLSKAPEYKGVQKATLERRYREIVKKKGALPLMLIPRAHDVCLESIEELKMDFPTIKQRSKSKLHALPKKMG